LPPHLSLVSPHKHSTYVFFLHDTATPEIYTLSLHDALPIFHNGGGVGIGYSQHAGQVTVADGTEEMAKRIERVLTNDPGMGVARDRKSTRLNSSHRTISYAVFCLKKKNKKRKERCNTIISKS